MIKVYFVNGEIKDFDSVELSGDFLVCFCEQAIPNKWSADVIALKVIMRYERI
jgi:hypothetical protein